MLHYLLCAVVITAGSVIGVPVTRGDTPVRTDPYFIIEQSDTTAMTGDHVQLTCHVANMQGTCQWTMDGLGLGVDPDLAAHPRYSMETSEDGVCILNIFPVLVEDEGTFQCQMMSGEESLQSRTVKLTVLARPGVPYIKQAKLGDVMDVVEGEVVRLDCETSGAKPAAEIQWLDRSGDIIEDKMLASEYTVTKNDVTKTYRTSAYIKLTPSDDMEVTCAAINEAVPDPRVSIPLKLRYNYKPRLSLNVTEDDKFNAGQDIKIQCSSQAYPPVKTFKWFVNEEEVLRNDNTDFITLSNLSKDMNKAVVKCQATNKIGTSEVSTVLNVQFNPKILLHPESVIAKSGEIVTFKCGAVGNPEPEYIWVRGEDNQIVGVSKSLQITAGDDTEDVYKCKVFVEGQELISRPARLDIIRAPVVTVHEEKVATVGDDVVLQCHVQSLDTKTKVTWTRNNIPVDKDTMRIRRLGHGNYYDLVIYNVKESDFTKYGCFAENSVGHDYKMIELVLPLGTSIIHTVAYSISVTSVIVFVFYMVWTKRGAILKRLLMRDQPDRPELPVVQRDVIAPIYRGNDPAVFDQLLNNGMDEKEYLRIQEEYFDNLPRR